MGILTQDELQIVHRAAISADLVRLRDTLLGGLDPGFAAGLTPGANPGATVYNDLVAFDAAGALRDGTLPLVVWLKNAILLATARRESAVFEAALGQVARRTVGATTNEGAACGAAPEVARSEGGASALPDAANTYLLQVKSGERVLAQGTAWLLRPDLVVTAFHVVGHGPGSERREHGGTRSRQTEPP